MKPAWLVELHRQWLAVRGKKVDASKRAYRRDWEDLLDKAKITSVEAQRTAERELLTLKDKLDFDTYKGKRIRNIILLDEEWLRDQFGSAVPKAQLAQSLDHIAKARERSHPRLPAEWDALCQRLIETFATAHSLPPFYWRKPESVRELLDIIHGLTAHDWSFGALVRDVSSKLGFNSKKLEKHQVSIERGLTILFGSATRFKSLGIISSDAMIRLSGPITLHFADGGSEELSGALRGPIDVSVSDLERAIHITTTATRLLTIENRKTTFRLIANANTDRQTLLAATSYPSPAFCEFLTKLPKELPHHHFGDTDPAGWSILEKLRQASPRPVLPFHMRWRPAPSAQPLNAHDRGLLPKLLASPLLADVHDEIHITARLEDRGDFEQESLGHPHQIGWPFYD